MASLIYRMAQKRKNKEKLKTKNQVALLGASATTEFLCLPHKQLQRIDSGLNQTAQFSCFAKHSTAKNVCD